MLEITDFMKIYVIVVILLIVQMSNATTDEDLDEIREEVFIHLANIGSLQLLTASRYCKLGKVLLLKYFCWSSQQ